MSTTMSMPSPRLVESVRVPNRYPSRPVAFLTQHGKERVVAPVLQDGLGCQVELVRGFDTDQLGTFTRDIPRAGTQLEAARAKAREGMRLSGHRLGLASEGSFGTDPMIGFFPWNYEFLIWIDDDLELEVVGVGSSRHTNHAHLSTTDWLAVEDFAYRIGFPAHHLILRPHDQDDPRIRKGLADWDALRAAFDWAASCSGDGVVFAETDMRAHANPQRMLVIEEAARDLLKKLHSPCPACDLPGFDRKQPVPGLRCEACRLPTDVTVAWEYACLKCPHRETRPLDGLPDFASAAECHYCNP